MTRELTGQAKNNRDRPIVLDQAKQRIRDRDPLAPADVEALLRRVYALSPTNVRHKLDEEGAQILEKGQVRGRLKAALTRTNHAAVDRLVSVYYSGHGIGHQYRPDVAR
jgi:hypothetical protein